MSLLKEIEYSDYIADKVNEIEFNYIKKNIDEYNYLNEAFDPEDNVKAMDSKTAIEVINNLYEQNYLYLKKQPWADILIKRIRKE